MMIQYDPLGKYTTIPGQHIIDMCAVVKHWVDTSSLYDIPLINVIHRHYGYELTPWDDGHVTPDGVYSYPEDPDLFPLVTFTTHDEVIHFYEYEILSIRNKKTNEVFTIRVD